jgi:hypothetical protein
MRMTTIRSSGGVFMVLSLAVALAFSWALAACDTVGHNGDVLPNPPSQAQIDDARDLVDSASAVADQGSEVLELLGLWPVYECSEPRTTFVGQVADGFSVDHPCVSVSASSGSATDSVTVSFPPAGCDVEGLVLSGDATLVYSGGTDRLDLEVDLNALTVDGAALPWTVGYGVCGDEDRVWGVGGGTVPGHEAYTFAVDLTVALQGGFPVFGSDTLLLNGDVELDGTGGQGLYTGTFTALEMDVGDYLPRAGSFRFSHDSGTTVRAVFSRNLVYGQVTLYINDHDPVTIPLL